VQREGVGSCTSATASSAARAQWSKLQRYRERRSARASSHRLLGSGVGGPQGIRDGGVRARRAVQREGVGPNTSATASSAARGRRSEPQRYRERRSARASFHRLLGGGVWGPPGGGVGGSWGEGRLPSGISVHTTIICPQNREQFILILEK